MVNFNNTSKRNTTSLNNNIDLLPILFGVGQTSLSSNRYTRFYKSIKIKSQICINKITEETSVPFRTHLNCIIAFCYYGSLVSALVSHHYLQHLHHHIILITVVVVVIIVIIIIIQVLLTLSPPLSASVLISSAG